MEHDAVNFRTTLEHMERLMTTLERESATVETDLRDEGEAR